MRFIHGWTSRSHAKIINLCEEAYTKVRSTSGIRALFLKATGKFFCAGADLKWMQKTSSYTAEQNQADAERLGAPCGTMLNTRMTLISHTLFA